MKKNVMIAAFALTIGLVACNNETDQVETIEVENILDKMNTITDSLVQEVDSVDFAVEDSLTEEIEVKVQTKK